MCTLTLHKNSDYVLVTMNRDEATTRPEEKPPYIWDKPHMIAPADTKASGTWIGTRADGFWACLLNGYLEQDMGEIPNAQSRGRIIPSLLSSAEPFAAITDLDLSMMHSFRLLLGNRTSFSEFFWNQRQLKIVHEQQEIRNYCVVSSSWKQDEVKQYRFDLHEKFAQDEWRAGELPLFHRYQEDDMDEWTPLMERSYAKTKSVTQLVIPFETSTNSEVFYWPVCALDQMPSHIAF